MVFAEHIYRCVLVSLILHSSAVLADIGDCQDALDQWCNSSPVTSACVNEIRKKGGTLPLVARRDTNVNGGPPLWRCYSPSCLDSNNTHYCNGSHCTLYCTEDASLLELLRNCTSPPRPAKLVVLDEAARTQGAVCLDGSPSAYYYRPGKNSSRSWVIEMEGGGWCFHDPPRLLEDVACWYRAYGPAIESNTPPGYLGSSRMLQANYSTAPPRGLNYILSDDPAVNPEFHDFNVVFVHYCDGASFTGDAYNPIKVKDQLLYYRGRRIRDAVIDDLLTNRGLHNADDVIITGCSAGGLAVILHLDAWRKALPETVKVKGLADSGFFVEEQSFAGEDVYPAQMKTIVLEQNSTWALHAKCVAAFSDQPWKCFFAEHAVSFVSTPLFILQTRFDSWQMAHIFKGNGSVGSLKCEGDIIASTVLSAVNSSSQAVFLEACYAHGLSITSYWDKVAINRTFVHAAFSQWYYDKVPSGMKWIDCDEPYCNQLCHR